MELIKKSLFFHFSLILLVTMLLALASRPIAIGENKARNGLKEVKAVLGVVHDVYDNENVRSLPERPQLAVVFHGEAVKLISSVRKGINDSDKAAINEFTGMVRRISKKE